VRISASENKNQVTAELYPKLGFSRDKNDETFVLEMKNFVQPQGSILIEVKELQIE